MTKKKKQPNRWKITTLLSAILVFKIILVFAVATLALPVWPGATQYEWAQQFCEAVKPIRATLPGVIINDETTTAQADNDPGFWDLEKAVARAAKQHRVDRHLLMALVKVESGFDPQAVSAVGAKGLCQLMPRTARSLDVTDPFDPEQNLNAGARYLAELITQFGDIRLALAGYNAGPVTVKQYGGIPPFGETRRFVREVLRQYREYRSAALGV